MERMSYEFSDGASFRVVLGEDGYNVNIVSDVPLMGTYTSLEKLLYDIAPVINQHIDNVFELKKIAIAFNNSFKNGLGIDGIEEILTL